MKHIAIILAAGSGKRMGTDCPKQFLEIQGKPVLYYCIKAFEDSFIDEIIIVTRENDLDFVSRDIVKKYNFAKVSKVVTGGKERYDSVFNGLSAIDDKSSYVYIHDGARAFVSLDILERTKKAVMENEACLVCVPSKDTVKISNEEGFVKETPDRSKLWCAQTPQAFSYKVIYDAFLNMKECKDKEFAITDDASVVELFSDKKVKIVEGAYTNIKITTPEDLIFGDFILASEIQ